jgi:predicted nuclease of restriction endonuclease-like RecB superfamily
MKKWDAIPPKQRNSLMARNMAKLAGMRSMGEVRCAADLKRKRIPYKYEKLVLEYQHQPQKYTPDFVIERSGKRTIIEYKGKMTNETRKKMLSIKRCNPELTICLVFEKPSNKIRKGSKTTYGDWAEKNGFLWSEHFVKKEWL